MVDVPFAIYDTTASQNPNYVDESHSPGTITGSIDYARTNFAANYMETDDMGKTGPKVAEFPSQSAGLDLDPDKVIGWPMDRA